MLPELDDLNTYLDALTKHVLAAYPLGTPLTVRGFGRQHRGLKAQWSMTRRGAATFVAP
ncbi:hypothetical protein [Hymenobacter terrenus]|uniref:hypothetical protein n=1 Tax=Hymenobacter terrenus TaxID=1629124 RepID=UPI0012E07A81|nr:hypothetical protein [Hymenobacter terrenus]